MDIWNNTQSIGSDEMLKMCINKANIIDEKVAEPLRIFSKYLIEIPRSILLGIGIIKGEYNSQLGKYVKGYINIFNETEIIKNKTVREFLEYLVTSNIKIKEITLLVMEGIEQSLYKYLIEKYQEHLNSEDKISFYELQMLMTIFFPYYRSYRQHELSREVAEKLFGEVLIQIAKNKKIEKKTLYVFLNTLDIKLSKKTLGQINSSVANSIKKVNTSTTDPCGYNRPISGYRGC